MNKVIAGLFAAALFGSFAMADTGSTAPASKDLKKVVEEGPYVETAQKGIKLSGYVDAGYSYNFIGNNANLGTSRFGSDATARGDFNLNAVKIALEKPLTDANELQAGFRVDALLGEDASRFHNGSFGTDSLAATASNSSDTLFLEQAYVQFRLPYGNGIDFKVGKFVTILGYEVVERPVNLNITYGNIFQNFLPVWNTGVISKYKFNDNVEAQFGVVNPSNSDNGIGTNTLSNVRSNDNAALVASVNLKNNGGNANLYQAVQYTINGDQAFGATNSRPSVVYDAYISWLPKFAKDKLLFALEGNIGNGPRNARAAATLNEESATWYGVALYGKYQFNDIFSLANRIDYTHTDRNGIYASNTTGAQQQIWSETVTAGFDVIENVQLRAEYRLDFGDYVNGTTNSTDGTGPVHYVGAEIVYSF